MTAIHRWREAAFQELSPLELYDLLALRSAVFVVEQQCVYQDLDGLDQQAVHLLGYGDDDKLLAYLRCLPPGGHYTESAMGRIVLSPECRGGQLGPDLVRQGIGVNLARWPGSGIRINAQAALQDYYARLGFTGQGEVYDEDGIPHRQMLWREAVG